MKTKEIVMDKQKLTLALECAISEAENPPLGNAKGYYDIFIDTLKEQGYEITNKEKWNDAKEIVKQYRSLLRRKKDVKAIHMMINIKSRSLMNPFTDFYHHSSIKKYNLQLAEGKILMEHDYKHKLKRFFGEECYNPNRGRQMIEATKNGELPF